MSKEPAPLGDQSPAHRKVITLTAVDQSSSAGRNVQRYRLEVNASFYACNEPLGEPTAVEGGTFWLEISSAGGRTNVEISPAQGSPRPFNPFFLAPTGRWTPASLAGPGRHARDWAREFFLDLVYGPTLLDQHNRGVTDQAAAKWWSKCAPPNELSERAPRLARYSRPRVELIPTKDRKRLELLAESPPRLEFREAGSGYSPERGTVSSPESLRGEKSLFRGHSTHEIRVLPSARRTLSDHIGWGHSTVDDNRAEQGGLLLGRVVEDSRKSRIIGLVEEVVPAYLANGSSTHLQFSAQAWKQMLDYVDRLEDEAGHRPKIIGWYHTHPGDLEVFMSDTDQETQRNFFYQRWHFSVVLNPKRREFRVYFGADSTECAGVIATDPEPRDENCSEPQSPVNDVTETARISASPPEDPPRRRRGFLSALLRRLPLRKLLGRFALLATPLSETQERRHHAGVEPHEHRGRGKHLHREMASTTGTSGDDSRLLMLRVTEETAGAPFLRGSNLESAREALHLFPGDTLRVLSGPRKGWYRVELHSVGWVPAGDLEEFTRGKSQGRLFEQFPPKQ